MPAAMTKKDKLLVLLGILGFFFLNYPLLQIFNREQMLLGVPTLIWYLFGIWILAIVGLCAFSCHLSAKEGKAQTTLEE
ncbi:MAG: hypothetical protein JRI57_05035 [Deltaproteobacteria bacterium]|nr:hypothetical protein [Deltaproteobacteria bacterium]